MGKHRFYCAPWIDSVLETHSGALDGLPPWGRWLFEVLLKHWLFHGQAISCDCACQIEISEEVRRQSISDRDKPCIILLRDIDEATCVHVWIMACSGEAMDKSLCCAFPDKCGTHALRSWVVESMAEVSESGTYIEHRPEGTRIPPPLALLGGQNRLISNCLHYVKVECVAYPEKGWKTLISIFALVILCTRNTANEVAPCTESRQRRSDSDQANQSWTCLLKRNRRRAAFRKVTMQFFMMYGND